MIGEKCDCCGDEVLIIRTVNSKKLCLDCYEKQNKTSFTDSAYILKTDGCYGDTAYVHSNNKGIRYCTKCGRTIPFDSIICPYCLYKFKIY
jgi:hypothetical protein